MVGLLLVSSALLSPPPVIIVVGDVSVPDEIPRSDAAVVLDRAGLHEPSARPPDDHAEAVKIFQAAADLFWERGRLEAAIKELRRGRTQVSDRVMASQRRAILDGLWLLAQLLLRPDQKGRTEAEEILELAVRIAPGERPSFKQFDERTLALDALVREATVKTWRTLTVTARGLDARVCRVRVDGLDRGPVGRALGPFPPTTYEVVVECAGRTSRARRVKLADTAAVIEVASWELGLKLDGGLITQLEDAAARACADTLRGELPVMILSPASDDRVTASVLTSSEIRPPLTLQPSNLAEIVASVTAPPKPTVEAQPQWWHWVLIGGGVAAIGTAGGLHAHGAGLHDETNAGEVDRRRASDGLEPTYIALYSLGGALITIGSILAAAP